MSFSRFVCVGVALLAVACGSKESSDDVTAGALESDSTRQALTGYTGRCTVEWFQSVTDDRPVVATITGKFNVDERGVVTPHADVLDDQSTHDAPLEVDLGAAGTHKLAIKSGRVVDAAKNVGELSTVLTVLNGSLRTIDVNLRYDGEAGTLAIEAAGRKMKRAASCEFRDGSGRLLGDKRAPTFQRTEERPAEVEEGTPSDEPVTP